MTSYIGKQPTIGNFQKCDAISVVNGQATYGLTVNSVAVYPESANHVLCSLNGILQAPTDSFTISSSNIVFASNLATGDVIDFVMILGSVLDLGVPSNNTVSASKLTNDIISGQTALTSEPADTDEFLVSDAGTIKRIDYSLIKGGGITEADQFRLTANTTSGTNADITANFERCDEAVYSKIGTGMTESSGVFTFPTTGLYHVITQAMIRANNDTNAYVRTFASSDSGSNYDAVAHANQGVGVTGDSTASAFCSIFINVTNASTFRVKFNTSSMASNSYVMGDTSTNFTTFTFIRLGDSQ
jgi:hypothetical protein